MTKIRVHEYAKQVNKTSKEVIEALNNLNVSVTNHMSMLEKDVVSKLNQTFKTITDAKQPTQNVSQKSQQSVKSKMGKSSNLLLPSLRPIISNKRIKTQIRLTKI